MASTQYNADGLVVKMHGEYESDKRNFVNRLKSVNVDGFIKQAVFELDLAKVGASTTWYPADLTNNGTNDGFSTEEGFLPSGASIVRVLCITTEVAVGGTDFTLGTYTVAGVAIDADGIISATEGVIANMGTVGEVIIGNGALVGDTSGTVGLTANSWVAATTNGTFTAGKATIVIEYIPGT